jgi:hypothetical protein
MACGGWQRLACALEGIADSVSDGPATYDVFADIVIPSLVGLGTLALAVASVVVARQSFLAEQRARKAAEGNERRAARRRISAAMRRYVMASFGAAIGDGSLALTGSPVLLGLEAGDEAVSSAEPHAEALWEEVEKLISRLPSEQYPSAKALAADTTGAALASIRDWMRSPAAWDLGTRYRAALLVTNQKALVEAYEKELENYRAL